MSDENSFLADGYERAYNANEPIVRDQVEQEFEERLSNVPEGQQKIVRKEIEAEIKKRLDVIAPPDALY